MPPESDVDGKGNLRMPSQKVSLNWKFDPHKRQGGRVFPGRGKNSNEVVELDNLGNGL